MVEFLMFCNLTLFFGLFLGIVSWYAFNHNRLIGFVRSSK